MCASSSCCDELEHLVWQPSGGTLVAAACVDLLLFVWTLAMLASAWIVVEGTDCVDASNGQQVAAEEGGLGGDGASLKTWLFIERACDVSPTAASWRIDCHSYTGEGMAAYPPGEMLREWQGVQACVALCCAASFALFWLLACGARAPAQAPWERRRCTRRFDKRLCQQVGIGLTVAVVGSALGCVAALYDSASLDPAAWREAWERNLGLNCEVSTVAGPAVGMAFLSVASSLIILGVLSCPGCHCWGCHEPGRCCASCVDKSMDYIGTSEV